LDQNNAVTGLFYPFTLTRLPEDLRVGILTIREKRERVMQPPSHVLDLPLITENGSAVTLNNITDIIRLNAWAIVQDFSLICAGRTSMPVSTSNKVINPEGIFIEEGAVVEHCFLNADSGPVYIGKNALLMEGSMLRGPVSIGENAMVKMGTKIYGATSIGPYCTAGGEIKNSVLMGYSNKAHDGYLGDSILGEWCNLGAGTSNSNIKNTGGNIKIRLGDIEVDAGTKFGLLMGDYSRAAINTSFNTGTVTGVCCNIFSSGLTPKFIDNFAWGCDGIKYKLEKAFADIDNWKKFKGSAVTEKEKAMLTAIYNNKTDYSI
jgi:UDP-N-acetylglucosamine diphosphorylase/glucosamine-1-phosphate N-acetyltransferase